MSRAAVHLDEPNLSIAWAKAFAELMEKGVGELSPLTVTVSGIKKGRPAEDKGVRRALDRALRGSGHSDCHTVANTLFPESLWNPKLSRERLYQRYRLILPEIRKCGANRRGTYFQRLISHGEEEIKQLEHVITTYKKGNHRRSALQAAVFDPRTDHTNQQRMGFPCLQQISFIPVGDSGLVVSGYYPMQYLFEKAYGNYLGLCRLGRFMAHEMGLELVRMTCITTVGKLGSSKGSLQDLLEEINDII